jgi:2-polyprenyl-6-methoxyphenol hydroxylase-like FAD-dependent oxidoreductase
MTKALIIGGGIAGPVAALALHRVGIEAAVFESHAGGAAGVGSYLTVATNGIAALQAVDAESAVIANGFATPTAILRSSTGKELARVALGSSRPGAPGTYTVRRSDLYSALRNELQRRRIPFELGKRLVAVTEAPNGSPVVARFADGTQGAGDVIIGADGVHSTVRRIIDAAAPKPRYVGLLNFGGYTTGAPDGAQRGVWNMVFGKRAFFGYTVDAAGNVVWFANVPHPEISCEERQARRADAWRRWLVELFTDDRTPAAQLIAFGTLELVADNTYDLPSVPVWHRGAAVIIGDAAHAPSPSAGQGASLAIEDAIALAKCLRGAASVPSALAAFEQARRERVERVVAHGARMSSNKTPGPIGRVIRDLALPLILRLAANEKAQRWLYDYRDAEPLL